MMKNLIVLPDGTELSSGASGAAIVSLEMEEAVNSGVNLMPGAVCAAMVQAQILEGDALQIAAGDTLGVYEEAGGQRRLLGTFIAQKPERNGKILKLTAYDKLTLLDKELSLWLKNLDGWPYSLWQLAGLTCRQCGLEFLPEEFPNGDFAVQPFPFEGVTGRQLLGWIAQAAGCFCKATPEGQVTFGRYEESSLVLTGGGTPQLWCCENGKLFLQLRGVADAAEDQMRLPADALQLQEAAEGEMAVILQENSLSYYQGGLSLQEFETTPIDGICIRQCAEDVGTVYPETGENRLAITGNPLLSAQDATTLLPLAQALFEDFGGISYTPCTVTLHADPRIQAGMILTVEGKKVYVMQLRRAAGQLTITCTGEKERAQTDARQQNSYQGLAGKVLKLRTDIDGIFAENADGKGKLARLQLDVEGLQAQAESTHGMQQQLTKLEQTADAIRLSVESMQTDGAAKIKTAVGYTFDDKGLQISREGQQMKNLLDNTGMYVTRNGETVLQASDTGVRAVDVKVGNFLIVGDHARFENYGAGCTACYWLEG